MSSSDFFKKLQPLFEAKECKEERDPDMDYDDSRGETTEVAPKKGSKLADPPKEVKIGKDLVKKGFGKQPTNTKESAGDFFRKYADIIAEAEEKEVTESWDDDDEDPDVAKADSVKGKDGKTQKDADKKLPPWLNKKIDKADKKDQDRGAKKLKKDKEALKDVKESILRELETQTGSKDEAWLAAEYAKMLRSEIKK